MRLLWPIVAAALATAGAVAVAAHWLGARRAEQQLSARYTSIERTLSEAAFPLNERVLQLLAELTQTELVTIRDDGSIAASTIPGRAAGRHDALQAVAATVAGNTALSKTIQLDERTYRITSFPRRPPAVFDDARHVVVLFDAAEVNAARVRSAATPLITGLTTTFLLASISLILTNRLVGRLSRLQSQVERVATGDFHHTIQLGARDELGMLAAAVNRMASQLAQLWSTVNQQQGEKLLHQIAAGMAHQLRNSLTGARMAVELHAQRCRQDSDEDLRVAISQIELSEDYVQRLMLVGSGRQKDARPAVVAQSLSDVRSSLSTYARHLRKIVDWQIDASLDGYWISDGPTLSAAITNLVINAIEAAGEKVEVRADLTEEGTLRVRVTDDGPGIPPAVEPDVFEPFVSSKPEGLGLGLPLVARAAEQLNGDVKWGRHDERTTFEFHASVQRGNSN